MLPKTLVPGLTQGRSPSLLFLTCSPRPCIQEGESWLLSLDWESAASSTRRQWRAELKPAAPGSPFPRGSQPRRPGEQNHSDSPAARTGPLRARQPRLEQLQRQINCQTQCELLSRFCLCGFSKHLVSFLHLTICSNFYLNNFSLHCIFLSLKETPSLF